MAKDEFKNLGFGNEKDKKTEEQGVKGELRWE